jgi:hypothetical protein
MLQKIKHIIFHLFLRFKSKKEIQRQPVTLQQAKNIGIVFPANDINQNDIIIEFIKKLKSMQKDVQILGYMPKREFFFVYPFPFISDKDTNWYGKPKGGTSGFFINTPFDLMVDFCSDECLPLEYISGVSSSKFRVGFNKEINNANYDLILIPKEKSDISNLIQNLEKYLK